MINHLHKIAENSIFFLTYFFLWILYQKKKTLLLLYYVLNQLGNILTEHFLLRTLKYFYTERIMLHILLGQPLCYILHLFP